MRPVGNAQDDIVATFEEAASNGRPPLLVTEPLAAFLDARGLGEGPIEATPIGDGRSNVTYLLRRGESEVVLRRPPRPPLPPSAHDVLREARVLSKLAGIGPVPAVVAVCEDDSVIGAPFYVMEKLEGRVVELSVPAVFDTPLERRRLASELIEALVWLHDIDWSACDLQDLGRPTGYLERQLRRWTGLWEFNRTRKIPAVERVAEWLQRHLPESGPTTIVHGDFRLGNLMFAPEAPARVVAVLDWELATLGDPLADLGYVVATWVDHDDPPGAYEHVGFTRAEGFPTRTELVAMYEDRSGRPAANFRWYEVLALWKSIVFMEGNYRRAISGATDDPFLEGFGSTVLELAALAEAVAFATRPGTNRS
jgi:aminoglycoside phosphotransferase (APT) family kinase protein